MLQVADRETWHDVGIEFRYDQGVVLGAISPHGTGKANYRPERQFRMAVSTYIADINEDTAEYLDEDTASFPPSYMPYYLSQMERHWKRNDHTVSLNNDKGRRPFVLQDDTPLQCSEWLKEEEDGEPCTDMEVRSICIKSCQVLLETEEY